MPLYKKNASRNLEGSSKVNRALEIHYLKCGSKLKFTLNTLGIIGLDPLSWDREKRPDPMDTIMNSPVSRTVKIV